MRKVICRTLLWAATAAILTSSVSAAAEDSSNPEAFRIEITGAEWRLNPTGTLAGEGTNLNLVGDLGFKQNDNTFYGKLVFKPGRKHRIIVDGTPMSFSGSHSSTRVFTYNGQTFTFNESLQTKASLDYVFAGYQYDFLSGRAGHLGASVGGAYINATGAINAPQANVTSSKSQKIGLPLAGLEFRVFPIPGHAWVDIDGGMRGMDFGSYGHYVEANVNGGVWIAGHVGLHGGYRETNALLQNTGSRDNSGQLNVRLRGPIYSLTFKW